MIGRVTGCGLARNLGDILPRPTVLGLVGLLFLANTIDILANTIDIGANLAAMGAAAQLSTDLPALPFTIGFAVVSVALQMFISYTTYARYLKWLMLVLLSYAAVLFVAEVDWLAAAKGYLTPEFPLSGGSSR